MNQNKSSTQQRTSDIPREDRMTAVMYLQPDGSALYAFAPKPPTPEMVARAQPYRADTLQAMEAVIKNVSTIIDV